jgi:hypothetical protein
MHNNRVWSVVGALLVSTALQAQQPYEQRKSLTSGVEFCLNNVGRFGHDSVTGAGGFFYPRGSNLAYVFGSGLWFGARKKVDGSLVELTFMTYDHYTGESWADPGEWTTGEPPTTYSNHTSVSPEYDCRDGVWIGAGEERPGWPLWGDGSANATLSNPGIYIPDSAARFPSRSGVPMFVSGVSEQFATRYHDGNIKRYEPQPGPGFPIGLQIEQHLFGFEQPALDNIVIIHYRIINVSVDTLFDCYTAFLLDTDIGQIMNDRVYYFETRPDLETVCLFTDPTLDDAKRYGTLVQTLIETPAVVTEPSSDRYRFIRHDRSRYDSTEQIGMTTFQNWYLDEIPRTRSDRYRAMTLDHFAPDIGPNDTRTLTGSGPFNMLPGDTARFAVALTVLPDLHHPIVAPETVEAAARKVIDLYRNGPPSRIEEQSRSTGGMSIGAITPNPADERTSVTLQLARRCSLRYQLVDMLGRVVFGCETGMLEAGEQTVGIDLEGVAPGVYLLSVESEGIARSTRVVVGE